VTCHEINDCIGLDQRSYTMPGPVSARMGHCLRAGKPSRCRTSHLGVY